MVVRTAKIIFEGPGRLTERQASAVLHCDRRIREVHPQEPGAYRVVAEFDHLPCRGEIDSLADRIREVSIARAFADRPSADVEAAEGCQLTR